MWIFQQESTCSDTDAKGQKSSAVKKAAAVEAPSNEATNTSEAGRGTDKKNGEAGRGADKESKGQNYERQHSDSANRGGQVSCVYLMDLF